jgi:hypothetical protein
MLIFLYTFNINKRTMTIAEFFTKILEISNENKYPDIHFGTGKKVIMRHHN